MHGVESVDTQTLEIKKNSGIKVCCFLVVGLGIHMAF